MGTQLPAGTVTFLFTDIEGSTRLWELYPKGMNAGLAHHDSVLRQAIEANQGWIVKTTGDGFHAVFRTAVDALVAALEAQRSLCSASWKEIRPETVRVRMGIHSGEAELRAGDYFGTTLNRAARLMAAGQGGQVLVSAPTAELVRDALPPGSKLVDLGEHRLKDLIRPEHIFQLVHPDLPAEFPPLRSLDVVPNNLPVQTTNFVGREREVAETRRALAEARLLTLTGSGGTGKTRLAFQLAADVLSSFPDGVWLAELASLQDSNLVIQTIAVVLGLKGMPGIDLTDLVTDYLRAKRLLLILDNCEHLIDACARLVEHFLRACPNLKVLVSSREALGIAGEVAYRVPSLSQPDDSAPTPAGLMASEAVQLFMDRALAANPRFNLTEANARAVAQICCRLDGIPLALELAAARTRVFPAEQIAARLDDRFRLLTGGSRTALPRQQTLRALIDWSYELLSEPERILLRSLSVFVGGWPFEAAEAICPGEDVLDLLTQLVNKSLVIVDEDQHQARYHLLETVRQYARDRLFESGEMAAVRDRHLDFFLRLSEEAGPHLRDSEAFEWIERLDPDFDNIRIAMEWGLERHPEETLRLAENFFYAWGYRIDGVLGLRILQSALNAVEALPPAEGEAALRRNQLCMNSKLIVGVLIMGLGDNPTAYETLKVAIDLGRESADPFLLAISLSTLGVLQSFLGDYEQLRSTLEEAAAIINRLGDRRWLAMIHSQMVVLERRAGNWEAHRRYMDQARQFMDQFEHPLLVTLYLGLGMEARFSGDFDLAREFLQNSLRLATRLKALHFQAAAQSELVHLTRLEGKLDEARTGYRQTILRWKDLGQRGAVANQLECLAFIARASGETERAARLFGAAEALREEIHSPMTDAERPDYEREVTGLREQMTPAAFSNSWAEGGAMNMERAVAYAIG